MPPDIPFTDKPYTVYTVEKRRRRRWPRVLLITLLLFVAVVAMAAGGTYLWLDVKLAKTNSGSNADAINKILTKPVATGGTETTIQPPNAQDILLIGSDNREAEGDQYGRSDTLMLVHIDPDQNFVSVLSIPRDLRVEIPGYGVQKINAAYAIKGAELSIKTVQSVFSVDLDHFVNIDFDAFRQLTTELDGIYVDVDRRYYYVGDDYETINIWPGYQALAGESALDYVRFRHDDNNDFGRIQRQQRFLRAAKEQVSKWDAALKIPSLVNVLARNVTTDMTTNQVLRLAVWGMRLQGGRVKTGGTERHHREHRGRLRTSSPRRRDSEAVRDLMEPPAASEAAPATTGPARPRPAPRKVQEWTEHRDRSSYGPGCREGRSLRDRRRREERQRSTGRGRHGGELAAWPGGRHRDGGERFECRTSPSRGWSIPRATRNRRDSSPRRWAAIGWNSIRRWTPSPSFLARTSSCRRTSRAPSPSTISPTRPST